ncbi:hypothetical protein V6N13_087750 [Hibiscus sabdariffa]
MEFAGIGTPIRRGLGGTSVVKWSPTGDYFFSGKFDGTFYLWETNTWNSEPWSSASGFVTGATWDPDGRMVLLAFSKSSKLGSIHFASKPPSLDAHLLPVDLPEIISLTGSQGIEKIAWDASGERLAVSYKGGDDIYKGLIAIYDTRRNPLISASLILNKDHCFRCAGAVDFAVPILYYFGHRILTWSRHLEATNVWYFYGNCLDGIIRFLYLKHNVVKLRGNRVTCCTSQC